MANDELNQPGKKSGTRVGWISSSVPKRCGIATFSRDLVGGMRENRPDLDVLAIAAEAPFDDYLYGAEVVGVTDTGEPTSFDDAARMLNEAGIDILVMQHEFGLFGGNWTEFERKGVHHRDPLGDNIFRLLDKVDVPVITTLHTVLPEPDAERLAVIKRIYERSAFMVTMTGNSRDILVNEYNLDEAKIKMIPHGVPSFDIVSKPDAKMAAGIDPDHQVLMITGLIGQNKSIDMAIEALAAIALNHPKAVLYVVGQTHPDILAHSGEKYREALKAHAKELGISDKVIFINQYLPLEDLVVYLRAADIYLTLHRDPEQAASGTLAYALGAGLVSVSTPYRYAEEVLAEGRGFLVPFDNSSKVAETFDCILADPELMAETSRKALAYGSSMVWPHVGNQYVRLMDEALA